MDFQNGEIQRDGHKGLLAAGQQGDGLEGFSRRLGLDLDAAAQDVLLVLQFQSGRPSPEELLEGGLETLGQQLELFGENLGHLLSDLADDVLQLALGLLHIVALVRQVGVAGVHPLELVDGPDVWGAQGGDVPLQLPDPPVGLGHALQLDPLCLGVGVGEFVVFPQPVQDLLFLHGGGGPLLVQFGHRPLQVQQVLVHLLARPVLGSPLRLQGVLLLCDGGQPLPEGRAPARQLLQRRLQSGDLFLRGGDVSAVGLRHLFLLLPVTREIRAQRPQVRGAADCGLPFGRQGSQIALSAADLLGQGTGFLQQLRLAGKSRLRLGPRVRGGGFLSVDLHLGGGRPGVVVRQPSGQALQLAGEVLHALLQGAQQEIILSPDALQPQDLVLCMAALSLRGLQLVLGGGQFPGGILLRLLCLRQLCLHGSGPGGELLQLRGPAQYTGGPAGAAAGHGAAPVNDLAVQRHDPEGVAVLPGHGDAAVQVLYHHSAAQQVVNNIPVRRVECHQPGPQAHKTKFLLHAFFMELVTPDGGEGQERGPSGVPLLQVADGGLGILLPVHHNVLQSRPQGDLDGQGVPAIGLHQIGHRAMDALQAALCAAHELDRLGEALVLLLHLCQQAAAVFQRPRVHGQLDPPLRGGSGLLLPFLHPQAVAGDDIGGGLRLVPGILQGAAVLPRLLPGGLKLLLRGGPVSLCGLPPLLDLLLLRGGGGQFRPRVRGGGHGEGLLCPQALRLVLGAAGLFRHGLGGLQQGGQRTVQLPDPAVDLRHPGFLLLRLLRKAAGTALRLCQLRLRPLDVLPVVGDGALQHGGGGLLLLDLLLQNGGLCPDTLSLHVLLPHPLAVPLPLGIEGVQSGAGLVPLGLCGVKVRLQLPGARLQGVQVLQPDGDLQKAQLIPEHQILPGLLRLLPQGLHLKLQLGDLVIDADQILLRPLQLPLRLLLPVAEFGNAGGLLEDLPPLPALGGEDLINLALADDGVALPAHAGVQEQLRQVLQPDRLAVDVVFAFAAAVIAAGDGHFALLHGGEDVLRVVQHQRHLGKAHLAALLRAAENHVLHLGATEALDALFPHHPPDSVGDVGLAGAVGTHDGGDVLAEIQDRLVWKGLKPLDFQCAQIQTLTSFGLSARSHTITSIV